MSKNTRTIYFGPSIHNNNECHNNWSGMSIMLFYDENNQMVFHNIHMAYFPVFFFFFFSLSLNHFRSFAGNYILYKCKVTWMQWWPKKLTFISSHCTNISENDAVTMTLLTAYIVFHSHHSFHIISYIYWFLMGISNRKYSTAYPRLMLWECMLMTTLGSRIKNLLSKKTQLDHVECD